MSSHSTEGCFDTEAFGDRHRQGNSETPQKSIGDATEFLEAIRKAL